MKRYLLSLGATLCMVFAVHAQPVNDLCSNATPISCGASIVGTTVGATFDNVGTCGTSNTANGVWYTIVGNGGPLTLSTCNQASYDTKISVFTGSCGSLSCVGGQDDAAGCSGFTTEFTFLSTAGVTYNVLVHGFGTATGTFTLSASCGAPPSGNDLCTGALPISCGQTVSGTTSSAAIDNQAFCGTSNTAPGVWYTYTEGANAQILTFSTCGAGTNYDTKLSVYSGSCGAAACVAGNDDDFNCSFSSLRSEISFVTSPGTTYNILVHGFGSSTGNFDLSMNCSPLPVNDGPCGAIALTLGTAAAYNLSGASADPGEVSPGVGSGPSSCDSQDGWCSFETGVDNSLWYTFVAPPSGNVEVSATGGDAQIAVYSVGVCGDYNTYTEEGANDDGGPGTEPLYIQTGLTGGQTYYVQVDGFNGAQIAGDVLVRDVGGLATVPTMGEWGLIFLTGIILLFGVRQVTRMSV